MCNHSLEFDGFYLAEIYGWPCRIILYSFEQNHISRHIIFSLTFSVSGFCSSRSYLSKYMDYLWSGKVKYLNTFECELFFKWPISTWKSEIVFQRRATLIYYNSLKLFNKKYFTDCQANKWTGNRSLLWVPIT